VVVIVSEETGTISVAINGMLKRYLSNETLRRLLTQELIGDEKKSSVIDKLKGHRKGGGKDARS
jgi:diadenylate cyclase